MAFGVFLAGVPPGGGVTTPVAGDVFTIVAGVVVGNVVYVSAANTVDKAFGGSAGQTADAIGVAITLPTATTANVVSQGLSGDIFTGLTVGAVYYLSDATSGAIMTPVPSADGSKIQEIGRAVSSTELYIDVDATSVIL